VAVLGSVLGSQYSGAMEQPAAELPAGASHVASDSLGGALVVGQQVGGRAGASLVDAAKDAYLGGFGLSLTIAAVVAFVGAAIAAIWLPARASDMAGAEEIPRLVDEPVAHELTAAA
jgi:DHA2 family multidrug resistance protein-like MFS transporter